MTMTEHDGEADGEGIARRAAMQSVAALIATGAAGAASAQEGTTGPRSSTPTPEGESVVVELGGNVRVTEWEFTDGAFSITFDADIPSALKITDTGAVMNSMTTGSGSQAVEIPTRGYSLGSDETTVEFAAEEFDGAYAVTVASSDGAALIRTDSVDAGSTSIKLQTAMLGGLRAAVGAGGLSYKRGKEALEEDDEPSAERII
jgi:hypothetical protein